MFGDNDLNVFFADFGVPVTFNGATAQGILDQPQAMRLADSGFGGFNAELPCVRIPYNAFSPMPSTRDLITVNYQDYLVTEIVADSDGAILAYSLKITS